MQPPNPPSVNTPPISFRDAVAKPKIQINEITDLKDGSFYKGEPALLFSDEEYRSLAKPFDLVLIGKFKIRPNMEFLRRGFQMIGFKGEVSLGLLDPNHVLLRFALQEDYYRCWIRGSWSFKKHLMKVLKWTPDFSADFEPPVAPVWVSFNHLPIHLFQKGPLMSLANLIGRPLRIDAATSNLSRPSVARVCIEVNLMSSLPKRIWIGNGDAGFWQSVTYEDLPLYCTFCSHLGHETGKCSKDSDPNPIANKPLQEWRLKNAQPVHTSSSGISLKEKASIPIDVPANSNKATNEPLSPVMISQPQLPCSQISAPNSDVIKIADPQSVVDESPIPSPHINAEPPESLLHIPDPVVLTATIEVPEDPCRPEEAAVPSLNTPHVDSESKAKSTKNLSLVTCSPQFCDSNPISHKLNVDATAWHPRPPTRQLPSTFGPLFEFNTPVNDYSSWRTVDSAEEELEEEVGSEDTMEDYLDSQYIRDDLYIEKRKNRHSKRERDLLKSRTTHPMCTRSKTVG